MKCPVCNNELHPFSAVDFKVDICRDGCGGIWFDRDEFERCNESIEPFPDELLHVKKTRDVVVDRSKLRSCPQCPATVMTRVTLDPELRLEIDHCLTCGGHWLDIGELGLIRRLDREDRELQARLKSYEERAHAGARDAGHAERLITFAKRFFK